MFSQQDPIVVDVVRQPAAARDISLDVVLGMFAMAGVVLLVAALGGLIVGGVVVLIRRARDRRADTGREPVGTDHIRLKL